MPDDTTAYVTVLTYKNPANKHVTIDPFGEPVKGYADQDGNYVRHAKCVHVPSAQALADVLGAVGNDPRQAIALGYVPELVGRRFTVRALSTLREKYGLNDLEARKVYYRDEGEHKALPIAPRVKEVFRFGSWILIDRDITPDLPGEFATLSVDEYMDRLEAVMPGVSACDRVVVPSTTGRVRLDGVPLKAHGMHIYVRVEDPSDLVRFREVVLPRAHLAGLGFHKRIDGGGSRPWTVFDPSVFSPERLVFDGAPTVDGDGLSVAAPLVTTNIGSRRSLDTRLCTDLTDREMTLWTEATGLVRGAAGQTVSVGGLRLDTTLEVRWPDGETGTITVQDFLDSGEAKLRANAPGDEHFRASTSWNYILRRLPNGLPILHDNGQGVTYSLDPDEAAAYRFGIDADDFAEFASSPGDGPGSDIFPDAESGGHEGGGAPESADDDPFGGDVGDDDFDAETAGQGGQLIDLAAEREARAGRSLRDTEAWCERVLRDTSRHVSDRINDCIDKAIEAEFGALQRESIANLIIEITGVRRTALDKAWREREARVRPARPVGDGQGWSERCPEWAQQWVYVVENAKFFNVVGRYWSTAEAFNQAYSHAAPETEGGGRIRPTDYVGVTRLIPHVERTRFRPGAGLLFNDPSTGTLCLNSFDNRPHERLLAACDEFRHRGYTPAEQTAVNHFRRHLAWAFPDEREQAILVSWLRWAMEHPDQKIIWAMMIIGQSYGAGKTMFADLIERVMGQTNTRRVDQAQMAESFSGWIKDVTMIVIDEVKVDGKEKYGLLNKLKKYVSDRRVPLRAMNKDAVDVDNFANFLMFSNFVLDALPLTHGDRRYCVLRTDFVPRDDARVQELTATTPDGRVLDGFMAYFHQLFDEGVLAHPMAVAAWICSQPYHPEFHCNGDAPMTEAKRVMTESSEAQWVGEMLELIEQGAHPLVQPDYVDWGAAADLFNTTHHERIKRGTTTSVRPLAVRNMLVNDRKWVISERIKMADGRYLKFAVPSGVMAKWAWRPAVCDGRGRPRSGLSAYIVKRVADQEAMAALDMDDVFG